MQGEVTTYQLDQETHEKLQKQTPKYYIERKEEGLKDKEIAELMGIRQSQLSQLKSRWDFAGLNLSEMKKKLENAMRKSKQFKPVKPKDSKPIPAHTTQTVKTGSQPDTSYEEFKKELEQKFQQEQEEKDQLEVKVNQLETKYEAVEKEARNWKVDSETWQRRYLQMEQKKNELWDNFTNASKDWTNEAYQYQEEINQLKDELERYKKKAFHSLELVKMG